MAKQPAPRHRYMERENGLRSWGVDCNECDVLVTGENAEAVSAMIAELFAKTPELPSDNGLIERAAQLFQRGVLLGDRVSAGRHTPAVPDGFSWCVLSVSGAPLALCHELTQALDWFGFFESCGHSEFCAALTSTITTQHEDEIVANKSRETRESLWRGGWLDSREVAA